jgi:hypothetical protein
MTDLGLITFVTDYTLHPVERARAVDEQLALLDDIAKLAERLR